MGTTVVLRGLTDRPATSRNYTTWTFETDGALITHVTFAAAGELNLVEPVVVPAVMCRDRAGAAPGSSRSAPRGTAMDRRPGPLAQKTPDAAQAGRPCHRGATRSSVRRSEGAWIFARPSRRSAWLPDNGGAW